MNLLDHLADKVYHCLGEDTWMGGNPNPPSDCLEGQIDAMCGEPIYDVRIVEDGNRLVASYAYPNGSEQFQIRRGEAMQLAWFILWEWWAKARWFGLKDRLWYWALSRRLGVRRAAREGSA